MRYNKKKYLVGEYKNEKIIVLINNNYEAKNININMNIKVKNIIDSKEQYIKSDLKLAPMDFKILKVIK